MTELFSFIAHRIAALSHPLAAITGGGGKTTLLYGLGRELAKTRRVLITTTTKIFYPAADECSSVFVGETAACRAYLAAAPRPALIAAGSVKDEKNKLHGYLPEEADYLSSCGAADYMIAECDGSRGRSLKCYGNHEPPVPQSCGCVLAVAGVNALGKKADEESIFRSEEFRAVYGLKNNARLSESEYMKYLCAEDGPLKNAPASADKILILNQWELLPGDERARMRGIFPALTERYDAVLCASERENILYEVTGKWKLK